MPDQAGAEERLEQNLAKLYQCADTLRLSGVQIKAPMHRLLLKYACRGGLPGSARKLYSLRLGNSRAWRSG